MARAFKTRHFMRWMRASGLSDGALEVALSEMQSGLYDADLGANLFKKRVPLPGRGKRGGARTIVVSNLHDRYFFVFGFAKNARGNVEKVEMDALRVYAAELLSRSNAELERLKEMGVLEEIDE